MTVVGAELLRTESEGLWQLVGKTPLLRLRSFEKPGVKLYAKCEMFNPGGSVKDRPALSILLDGIRSGHLSPGKSILDATSGNMGVSYSMLAASLGYRAVMVSPANISPIKLRKMKAFGAQVILTDALEGIDGAIQKVREMYEQEPEKYFYADQYSNPANPRAHYESTGPEVWMQTGGKITHFVAGVGTSGTLQGTARFLKEKNPRIKVVEVQPEDEFHGIEGLKHMASALRPSLYREDIADNRYFIRTEDAAETSRRLARSEGLLSGYSGGAALRAAVELIEELDEGVVVVVLPDGYGDSER
ncbi:MAG: cysteine synthase family protein [Candidatus Caldarchaeum sp.]|jgi:cysteine synthase B|uniref:Cysteine synthase family protein n=1 Tax=Caldiarchaeum subterraneum TaxID=311458 RepID=A0A7C4E1V4_CALS0|nr:cysteine synthase family protein [Candidatus Caldarchaeales archaeon]MDJ0272243.1 cysteine synthase family protein [Candidatus Caldarchaeales archaeon]